MQFASHQQANEFLSNNLTENYEQDHWINIYVIRANSHLAAEYWYISVYTDMANIMTGNVYLHKWWDTKVLRQNGHSIDQQIFHATTSTVTQL